MSQYTLTQENFRRLKTRLTTKTNKLRTAVTLPDKDGIMSASRAVVRECNYAMAIFEDQGSPHAPEPIPENNVIFKP